MNKRKLPNGQTIKDAMGKLFERKPRPSIEDIIKDIKRGNPLEEPFIINVTEDTNAAADRLRKILNNNRDTNKVFIIGFDLAQKRTNDEIRLDIWIANNNLHSILPKEDESSSIPGDIKKEGFDMFIPKHISRTIRQSDLLDEVFLNKKEPQDSEPTTPDKPLIDLLKEWVDRPISVRIAESEKLNTITPYPTDEWERHQIRTEFPFSDGGFAIKTFPTYNLPFESDNETDEEQKQRMLAKIHELNEKAKEEITKIELTLRPPSVSIDFTTDTDELWTPHDYDELASITDTPSSVEVDLESYFRELAKLHDIDPETV